MQDNGKKAKGRRKPARKANQEVTGGPSIAVEGSAVNELPAPSSAPAIANGISGGEQPAQCANAQQQQPSIQSKMRWPPWAWQGGVLLAIAAAVLLSGPLAGEHSWHHLYPSVRLYVLIFSRRRFSRRRLRYHQSFSLPGGRGTLRRLAVAAMLQPALLIHSKFL